MKYFILTFCLLSLPLLAVEPTPELISIPPADAQVNNRTLVGDCINVLTGKYAAHVTDLTIPSAEPLSISRFYTQNINLPSAFQDGWSNPFCSRAVCNVYDGAQNGEVYSIEFIEPNGAAIFFQAFNIRRTSFKALFYPCKANFIGRTNLNSNARNFVCQVANNLDQLAVASDSGHQYILSKYDHEKRKKATALLKGKECFSYRITSERKPNGNLLTYKYDDAGNLIEIKSLNAAKDITFGSLQFSTVSKTDPSLTISANDGRKIIYTFEPYTLKNSEGRLRISQVESPEKPLEKYEYITNEAQDISLLSKISYLGGRFLEFQYYPNSNRIQTVLAPVGPNNSAFPIYRFSYSEGVKDSNWTEVFDANNHRTVFHYNREPRIKMIERYKKSNLFCKEKFYWMTKLADPNCSYLMSETVEDHAGNVLRCRSYVYDKRGNVVEEQLWGKLTGNPMPPIEMDEYYPKMNGAECYTITRKYSNDPAHLLLEEQELNGKTTRFTYYPQTNLLASKIAQKGDQYHREFFFYDEKTAVVVKKIVDDGHGVDSHDLTGVSKRYIEISTINGIGLPEVVEEYSLDLVDNQEKLLNRTTFKYDAYGNMIQKNTLDNASYYWEYNDKGLLIKEWDNTGRTMAYGYDVSGNRIYTHALHLGVEIFDSFDLANRNIRSEIKYPDGNHRIKEFEYDALGQMIASTDNNKQTRYEYDAFGHVRKIIYPETIDENGDVHHPTETYQYDPLGYQISHTNVQGQLKTLQYNVRGQPIRIDFHDGTYEKYQYALDGTLEKIIGSDGEKRDVRMNNE